MRPSVLLTAILALCLLLPPPAQTARADCDPRAIDICRQVDHTRQQAGSVQGRLDHIKNQIQALEAKDIYLAQLIQQIQGQIAAQKKAVQETQGRIRHIERKIRFSHADIIRREAHLTVREQLLAQRVRALAKHGSIDYLALMVTATSFAELIDRVSMMQSIIQSEQKMVGDLRKEHDQVQGLKRQLDRQRAQLRRLLQQQKDQQVVLQRDLEGQEQALAYQRQLEVLLGGQRRAMENQLATLNTQLDQLRQRYQEKIRGLGGATGTFIWPIDSRLISQRYGCTDFQIEPYWPSCPTHHMHTGLDVAGPDGAPIFASEAGVVIFAGWTDGGYGNRTMIAHAGGYTTTYNHQSSIVVSAGQMVQQGQVIGYEGSTGNSTGPHIHFEILLDNNFQDPCASLGC